MGEIWRATDLRSGQAVAVKRLLDQEALDDQAQRRLLREASALQQISHPNVVRCLDAGIDEDQRPFLVLEWLEGEDLARRCQRGALSLVEGVAIARQALQGLAVCHERGIVHRDVKPANIFLVAGADDAPRVKLLDFGLVRLRDRLTRLTGSGTVLGTLHYMAPEQIRGTELADHRCDLYAMGVVLYELTTGRLPFDAGEPAAVMLKIVSETPPWPTELRPEIPAWLEEAILQAMRRAPSARFQTAEAMLEALSEAAPEALTAPARALARQQGPRPRDREQRLVSLLCLQAAECDEDQRRRLLEAVGAAIADARGETHPLMGRQVIGLFGLQQTTGDEAVRAVRAWLGLPPEVRAQLRALAATVRLEVGRGVHLDSTGLDDATRALAGLSTGELLIDDNTRQLVGEAFALEATGRYQRVVGERPEPTRPRRVLGVQTPTVGRETELASLRAVVRRTLEYGEAEVVWLGGAAGVGKSRLVRDLLPELSERAALCLRGRADAAGTHRPYALVADALLRATPGTVPDQDPVARRAALREMIGRFVGEAAADVCAFVGEALGLAGEQTAQLRVARADPALMRQRITDAFGTLLDGACGRGLVAICLEDLQWADEASLQLCEALLARLQRRPLLLLLSGRQAPARGSGLLDGAEVTSIDLQPLSRRALGRLVRAVLGPRVADDVASVVAERCAGNPYFAEELISWMVAEDLLVSGGGGWELRGDPAALELPASIEGAVQRRLDQLPRPQKELLKVAAVFGETFWAEGCSELGAVEVDEALAVLSRAELVVAADASRLAGARQWCFRQGLVRQVAYQMLPQADRAALHRRAAAWLEGAGETDAALLARHLDDGGDQAQAAGYHARAGELALAAGDPKRALGHCEAALRDDAAPAVEKVSRLLGLGRTLYRLGRYDDAELALQRTETGALADAANHGQKLERQLLRGQILFARSRYPRAEAVLNEAAAAAGHEESFDLTHSLFWVIWAQGRYRDTAAVAEKLLRIAERDRRGDQLCSAHLAQAYFHVVAGDLARSLSLAEQAVADAREVGHAFRELDALIMLGSAQDLAGLYAQAEQTLLAAERAARRLGTIYHLTNIGSALAQVLVSCGKLDAALSHFAAAVEHARTLGDHRSQAIALAGRARALCRTGRAEDRREAEDAARNALALVADRAPPVEADARLAVAQVFLAAGRHDQAVEEAQAAVALLEQLGTQERFEVEILLTAHDALAAAGQPQQARAMLEQGARRLEARAARISDAAVQQSFLEQVSHHARLRQLVGDHPQQG